MKSVVRFAILMLVSLSALAVPGYINYQGRLLDSSGVPVTQSNASFVVSIWTASTAGTKLYQENQTVNVNDGVYSFQIGNGTGGSPAWNPTSIFNTSSARYVELTVNGQTLSPRHQLLSTPFTFQSGNSDKLGGQSIGYFGTAAAEASLQSQISSLQSQNASLQSQLDELQQVVTCNAASTTKWSFKNQFCFGGTPPACKELDFKDEKFPGVQLLNADCQGANFGNVDFQGASFSGETTFLGADFSGANVTGVSWGAGVTCPDGTVIEGVGQSCDIGEPK